MASIQIMTEKEDVPLNYLEFVISGSKDWRFAAGTHERSWEKTKNDDSKVGGEKNLVDDTRFLRK